MFFELVLDRVLDSRNSQFAISHTWHSTVSVSLLFLAAFSAWQIMIFPFPKWSLRRTRPYARNVDLPTPEEPRSMNSSFLASVFEFRTLFIFSVHEILVALTGVGLLHQSKGFTDLGHIKRAVGLCGLDSVFKKREWSRILVVFVKRCLLCLFALLLLQYCNHLLFFPLLVLLKQMAGTDLWLLRYCVMLVQMRVFLML